MLNHLKIPSQLRRTPAVIGIFLAACLTLLSQLPTAWENLRVQLREPLHLQDVANDGAELEGESSELLALTTKAAPSAKDDGDAKKSSTAKNENIAGRNRDISSDQQPILKEELPRSLSFRFLEEAAQRALRSKTSWSDLAEVALAFHKAGDLEKSHYWFKKAVLASSHPNDAELSSQRLFTVVKSMISSGEFDLAEAHLSRISESSVRDKARIHLIRNLAGRRRFDEAKEHLTPVHGEGNRVKALQSIANFEALHLGPDEAHWTLAKISDPKSRDWAHSAVAHSLAKKGKTTDALQLLTPIAEEAVRDKALDRVARSQTAPVRTNDPAFSLIRDPFFRDVNLRQLIEDEADRRRVDLAGEAVKSIKSPAEQLKAEEALVQIQVRHGDFHDALRRAQNIPVDQVRHRAIQSVAVAEVREFGPQLARDTANLITSQPVRESTLRKIAQRSASVGDHGGAMDTIGFMNDSAEKAQAFAEVALTQARYGEDREARHLADYAKGELQQVEDQKQESRTVGVLAEVYAETGESDLAFSHAESIPDRRLRDRTYQKLADRFAKASDVSLAEQSASRIEKAPVRERVLDSVARTLASRVPVTEAFHVANQLEARRQQVRFLVAVASR